MLLVVLVRAALGRTHEISRDRFLIWNSVPGTARIDLCTEYFPLNVLLLLGIPTTNLILLPGV